MKIMDLDKTEITSVEDIRKNFEDYMEGKKVGYICLPVQVANITTWYGRSSPYSIVSGITQDDIENVIYYKARLVLDPKDTPLKKGAIMDAGEYAQAVETYGKKAFMAVSGAEAIDRYVREIDRHDLYCDYRKKEKEYMEALAKIRDSYNVIGNYTDDDLSRSTEIWTKLDNARHGIDAIYYLDSNPHAFMTDTITLFPRQLRAAICEMYDSMTYGVRQDLEDWYVSIFNRAERLKKLIDLDAPESITQDAKRLLQERVDDLIANGMRGEPKTKGDGIPIVCLTDVIVRRERFL